MFLCVIVYRLIVLNFWWHRHREYQLVTKLTVPCFLTRVIFTVSAFPLWYAPAVPPELGSTTQIGGGTLKKIPAVLPTSKPCRRLWLAVSESMTRCKTGFWYLPWCAKAILLPRTCFGSQLIGYPAVPFTRCFLGVNLGLKVFTDLDFAEDVLS